MADIFVSYTSSDSDAAHWIAHELEALGHTPHIHEWEIKGGDDIYAWMQDRHDAADRVLCVVSDDYLKAPYSTLERNAALWQAAAKRPGFALLVVVKPCKLPTLADHLRRCELFGLPEEAARLRLRAFLDGSAKPERMGFFGQGVAVSNITIHVPAHFMGRDNDLAAVREALARYEGRVAITALYGLRGVGKTTLAAAYAERHRSDYRATWWIRAQTEPTMRADLVGLGVRLGWVEADAKEEPALATVMERLRHEGEGILLIYDNAVDARSLTAYLPRGGAARVVVTSNDHAWRGLAEPVEIRLWPETIGADYLIARTGRTAERAAAESLSKTLGGLPLAHEQAAAFCELLGVSLSEYARRFATTPTKLLADDDHAPAEYHDGLTVARTFAMAIEQAALRHPAAEALIVHAALLPPEPIPLFLFEEGRTRLGEPLATLLADDGLDKAIRALRIFALVDRETIADEREPVTTDTIRLHRLVREVAASGLSTEEAADIRRSLLSAMRAVYPERVFNDPATWPRARRLDALALGLVEKTVSPGAENDTAWLLDRLASYRHWPLAAYAQARPLFERALAIREKALGPDHPDVAASLNNLAGLMQEQGDFTDALPLFERALAIREKALGPTHPNVASSLNNLARLLQTKGDFAGARPLYDRALAIREATVGPDHPYTALSLSNLAGLLRTQGDVAAARPLCERALAIRERVLGPDHPDTATSLNEIARLLQAQGDLAGARPFYERALAIREKALGPDHPTTATSLNNLALLQQAQGDLPGARPLLERGLAICETALGPDHPHTATGLNNLASLLHDQGDLAVARPFYERALAIYETVLGRDHPHTSLTVGNLARLLLDSGQPSEAALLGERALTALEAKLGATHAWTTESARVTADAWDALGRTQDAAALRQRFGL
jgi:tetratricopeptide (TPR) repeat protein